MRLAFQKAEQHQNEPQGLEIVSIRQCSHIKQRTNLMPVNTV